MPAILVPANTPLALKRAARIIRTLPKEETSKEIREAFHELMMDTADSLDRLAEEMENEL